MYDARRRQSIFHDQGNRFRVQNPQIKIGRAYSVAWVHVAGFAWILIARPGDGIHSAYFDRIVFEELRLCLGEVPENGLMYGASYGRIMWPYIPTCFLMK